MKKFKINNEALFTLFLVMIIIFALLSFQKYFLNMDYVIMAETSCNPEEEQCFVGYCDPEYEECSDIEEENIFYYKKIQGLASNIPLCDPEEDLCAMEICDTDKAKCVETFCYSEDEESECSSFSINEQAI